MRVVGPPTSGPPKVAKPDRRVPHVGLDASAAELRGSVIEVPVTCPRAERTGAAATITLVMQVPRAAKGGPKRRSRAARIASETVDLGSGERKVVRFRLSRKHRLLVRRARRTRLTAEITAVNHKGRAGRRSQRLSL